MSDMSDRMSDTMPGIPNWLYQANLSLLQNWFLKLIVFGALSSTKLISIKLVSPKPIKPISSKAVSWDLSLSNTRLCQAHLYTEQFRVAGLALCHCVLGIVGWRSGLVWQVQHLTLLGFVLCSTWRHRFACNMRCAIKSSVPAGGPFRTWNRRRTNPGLVRDQSFSISRDREIEFPQQSRTLFADLIFQEYLETTFFSSSSSWYTPHLPKMARDPTPFL